MTPPDADILQLPVKPNTVARVMTGDKGLPWVLLVTCTTLIMTVSRDPSAGGMQQDERHLLVATSSSYLSIYLPHKEPIILLQDRDRA